MGKEQFEAMLVIIIPQIIQLIVENYECDEIQASRMFYESKVNELLEDEETKMWHLSPLALFTMFDEEYKTGNITIPKEA